LGGDRVPEMVIKILTKTTLWGGLRRGVREVNKSPHFGVGPEKKKYRGGRGKGKGAGQRKYNDGSWLKGSKKKRGGVRGGNDIYSNGDAWGPKRQK